MARVLVGTSGWNYKHWGEGVFYPKGLPSSRWLAFYVQHFDTVEINNSFYRLPSAENFTDWRFRAPENFTFAVKASRFLTHLKRLKEPEQPLRLLRSRVVMLGEHLGPLLFQLPPGFRMDRDRLDVFLRALRKSTAERRIRSAIEIRDASWMVPEVFNLLRQYNVALCFADWRDQHVTEPLTADFVYVRRHYGPRNGSYTKEGLHRDARQIQRWRAEGLDCYIYFNNDGGGHAVRNAQYLRSRLLWQENCSSTLIVQGQRPKSLSQRGRVSMPANSRSKSSKNPKKRQNGSAEDAITMLKSDHTQVKRLLKQLSKSQEDATEEREELLSRIESELKVHTQLEEEIFYPQFRDAATESDTHLYFEAVEEHSLVDIVLPTMKQTDTSSEEFAAKAKVLLDLVEHHIEEEEGQMFPKAKRAMGATTLQELGEQMAQRKQQLMGGMMEEEGEEEEQESMSPRGGRRRRAA